MNPSQSCTDRYNPTAIFPTKNHHWPAESSLRCPQLSQCATGRRQEQPPVGLSSRSPSGDGASYRPFRGTPNRHRKRQLAQHRTQEKHKATNPRHGLGSATNEKPQRDKWPQRDKQAQDPEETPNAERQPRASPRRGQQSFFLHKPIVKPAGTLLDLCVSVSQLGFGVWGSGFRV